MRPARSRSSSAVLALGSAAVLLLTTGCGARFARSEAAAQSLQGNGGLHQGEVA